MTEQVAFRVPDGTKDRLRALTRPGESMTSVLLRALDVVEQSSVPADSARGGGVERQISELTARIARIEKIAPIEANDESSAYPPETRMMALWMREQGVKGPEIRAAIFRSAGRAPTAKHLSRTLQRWEAMHSGTKSGTTR